MLELALKELTEHRMRTILTALGITIAITAIVSLGSISAGVNALVTDSTSAIGSDTIFVMKDFDFSEMSGPPGSTMIEDIDSDTLDEISQISGVERILPVIARQFGGFFEVDGLDLEKIDLFGGEDLQFKEGTWPESGRGAALGYVAANSLDVVVGDYITLEDEEVEVVGIFEEGSGAYDLVVLLPYELANEIYDAEGGATQVMIEPIDITLVDGIKEAIEEEHDDLSAMTMEDAMEMMQEATLTLNVMTFGIGFVASLVAAIGIIITMYTSVIERRRQIGIMKAVGAVRSAILKQIMEEGLIISVASSMLGLFISFFFVDILNNVMLGGSSLAKITIDLAAGAVAYGVILTLLSSIYPAWVAVNTDPIDAIRNG